jgi:oligopeptidase B
MSLMSTFLVLLSTKKVEYDIIYNYLHCLQWSPYECLELGDPSQSEEAAKYILSYSPYQCVESKAYPHMLITAGWNDSRISFAEPTKYVAKLRKLKTDSNLLLLKTSLASGHRGASGRFSSFEEIAFMYAFLIDR